MNRRQMTILTAILFFITAGVWFFKGERTNAIMFFAIACMFVAISFSSNSK